MPQEKPAVDLDLVRVAETNLSRLLDWVGRFDNKSSVLLGLNTAMLGVLAGLVPPRQDWTASMLAVSGSAVLLLGLTFFFIYGATYPRTRGPSRSLLYLGSISSLSCEEFQRAFVQLDKAAYLEDLLRQSHRIAEILHKKFVSLKRAYVALAMSMIPWAFSVCLLRSRIHP